MNKKDELDTLLNQWQDVPAADPHLKHHVWTRIAAEDAKSSPALPSWMDFGLALLSKPLGATLFVLGSIVCGIVIAELRVNQAQSIRTEELAQNYIQLIEARTQTLSTENQQ